MKELLTSFFKRDTGPKTLEEMYAEKLIEKKDYSIYIYRICVIISIILWIIAGLSAVGKIKLNEPLHWIDFVIAGYLVIVGPYGIIEQIKIARMKKLEEKLPEFLRDVAEAGRFGMTLAAAIRAAAKGRYGPLTPEIRKMADQIGWGVSATDSLKMFGERVKTPLVKRVCAVVIKAATAGGNVSDILSMVSEDIKETQLGEEERKAVMVSYLVVLYVSFMVFILVIIILDTVFMPQMEQVSGEAAGAATAGIGGGGGAGGGFSTINTEMIPQVKFVYFLAAVVHGIGDGLVAGVLHTGQISNGCRHSFIMTLIAYASLRMFMG